MNRLARVLVSVFAAAVGGIGVASSAGAEAPDQQGWWTQTNPGLGSQTGLEVPATPVPADVPSNGLLLEGGSSPDSPIAYAALVYQLPVGANATSLTLIVATGSASTPASTLQICALVTPYLNTEQGGPMGDAPAYDCSHSATAGPSADGTSYRFQVAPLVTDGNLAIAILPTAMTDRVVLDQPDSNSLTVTAKPTPTNPAESAPDTVTGVGSTTEGATSPAGANLSSADATSVPSDTSQSPSLADTANATTQPAVVAPTGGPFTAITSNGAGSRSVIPSILALIASAAAAVLWAAAGRTRPSTDTNMASSALRVEIGDEP
jgi:hypothetical protein